MAWAVTELLLKAYLFMTLQLEYTCTEAEMKEAQSLNLQRQCGGGPKWRSQVIYWAFIAVVAVLVYLRFKMEIAPEDRTWFIALVVVVFIALQLFKRKTRRKLDEPARLEISERELVFTGSNGRTVMPWSAFSQCLESPALFVLINRARTILWTVPKRSFPDEKSQDWFRTLTNQLENTAASSAGETSAPGRFAAKGITLTVQLGYRDYLTRMFTSWGTRGMALVFLALILGVCLFASDPPDAVNSRGKTLVIMLAMVIPMMAAMFFVVAFVSWRSEKKFVEPQQVALSGDGIQYAGSDVSGLLVWSTYKYYLENRWAFFVWNPQGSLWMMFPKRAFASRMEMEQCRDLLRTKLKASRWFFF
ncbi:MAG TPA: YcxB family protein [Verrucomicrobiae bacterium]|nr:YcxB family protein [Verrucomicrobiae bacterium]